MSRRQVDATVMVPRVATLLEPKGNTDPPRRMRVASPAERGEFRPAFSRGRVLRLGDLRSALNTAHGADDTCPMTTAMFLRMRAEHADKSLADDHVA
jgi:hypothetical protein